MDILLTSWLFLFSLWTGVPLVYIIYLRRMAAKPWNLKVDHNFRPEISVLIPMHNEEKTIRLKLENLMSVAYPKEKMQVVLANDASTDRTMEELHRYVEDNPAIDFHIIDGRIRQGKATILNAALECARNNVIVMSDADTFWASDILVRTLPYLADQSVGGLVGRPYPLNRKKSLAVQTEKAYLDLVSEVLRYGESKIHSTIFFHGAFAAYKRRYLQEFNIDVDDSGTALDIVQRGGRTLFVPEGMCFVVSPVTWRGKIKTKIRRAIHLTHVCAKCLKLMCESSLSLPRRIAIPEVFIYLISPAIFAVLAPLSLFVILSYLPYSLGLILFLLLGLLLPRTRFLLVESLQISLFLLLALCQTIFRKKIFSWETLSETRELITREMLAERGLI